MAPVRPECTGRRSGRVGLIGTGEERGWGGKGGECRWNVAEGLEILGRDVSPMTSMENDFICF